MKGLEGAEERSREMLDVILHGIPDLDSVDRITKEAVADLDAHFTPGFIRYRKSVAEAGDVAALEWIGEGSIIRDARGREWIDCLGGYGIYNLGIRNPEVIAAVRAQLDRNPMPSQELVEPFKAMLIRLLTDIAPGEISNAFICNSGTEAVEGSMKVARVASGRQGFLVAEGAFHGKTLGSLSLMGKAQFREPVEPLLGPVFRIPFGDAAAAEAVLREHGKEIAAVVMEPIQGEAGAVVPGDDFWPSLRASCDRYGVLLIADEVQTGLGRTGALWAVDHWGVAPDIVCSAKSLGGGVMPVGALMGKAKIWAALEANPFLHTSTFGGNPLACVAAVAGIHVLLRERLWERAARLGENLLAELGALRAKYPEVLRSVRGKGLLIGMVFPDNKIGYRVAAGLFRRGVLVAGTQIGATTFRIEPALTIPEEMLEQMLERLADTLAEIAVG